MSTDADLKTQDTSTYLWPIIFAIAPTLFSILFGNSKIWGELLLLLMVLLYLYLLLKGIESLFTERVT